MARGLFIERLMLEEELQNLVLESDIKKASLFGSERRRREFLTWRAVVYRELGFGVNIEYSSVGAPIISNVERLYISVSHSSTHIALVISSNPCTVDIESTTRNFTRISSRYISKREEKLSKDILFPAIAWSAKEALYKLSGEKYLDFIEDISIESLDREVVLARVKGGGIIKLSVEIIENSQIVVVYLL